MKKRSIFVLIFSILMVPLCNAEESFFGTLPPAQVIENEESDGTIIIDSNVSGAEVYINGEYKGRTRLEISDLVPGIYTVKLVKNGYAETCVYMMVRKGYTNVYEVAMGKEVGYINLANITSDCEVYIDGQRLYVNPVEALCGKHDVVIKRFGYESFKKEVDVKPGKTIYVTANLVKTGFKAENLSVSKKIINPKYGKSAGSCVYVFEAAATGNVKFQIVNKSGNIVFEEELKDLSERVQKIKWDGKNQQGNISADGEYFAKLVWNGGEENFESVTVDSGFVYPLFCAGNEGSSLGSVALSPSASGNYLIPYLSFGASFVSGGESLFKAVPVKIGVIGNVKKAGEFSAGLTVFPGVKNSETPFLINGAYKYTWNDLLNSNENKLSVSAYLRYGYATLNYASYCYKKDDDYGKFDFGAGFATGTSFTYERNKICGIYSFALVFAPESGKITDLNQYIVKNSIAASYEVSSLVKGYIGGTLICADSFELDLGMLAMPFFNTIVIDSRIESVFAKENSPYFCVKISLSYLF